MSRDPRAWLSAWILASLASRRGFASAWAILLGVPLLILAALLLIAGGPDPGGASAGLGDGAAPGIAAVRNLPVPAAAREQMGRLSIARHPPTPEFPPAQAAPALPSGRLFGLRADQRATFNVAARLLVGLRDACGARLGPDAPAGEPPDLTAAQAALDASIKEGDKVRGLINYHHGLIDLCAGQAQAAKGEFDKALEAIDGAGAGLKAATARDTGRLAQYRIVAHYARGVAELVAAQNRADYDAAVADFDAAQKATQDPALLRHSGAFVELSSAKGDLFDFSSADLVQARIAARLAEGDVLRAGEAAGPALQASGSAIDHPALAATLALAAAAAGRADIVQRLDDDLRAAMGPDPANSDWAQKRKALLTQFLEAAATAPVKIFVAGDEAWWPGGADAPAATDARRVFDEKGREGVTRDALWFPPLSTADPADAPILDRFLWIRREMVAAAADRFDRLDALRRAEASLPASDRLVLDRVRREMLGQIGDTLMKEVEQVRRQDGGARAVAPLLMRLSSVDFPPGVWIPARLARMTGQPPARVVLLLWVLVVAALVLFLVHRELWIGHQRTFTHRHHDQRLRAGPGWADIPAGPAAGS
jgi:hypothetical protein